MSIFKLSDDLLTKVIELANEFSYANRHLFNLGEPFIYSEIYGLKEVISCSNKQLFKKHIEFCKFLKDFTQTNRKNHVKKLYINLEDPIEYTPFNSVDVVKTYISSFNLLELEVSLTDFGGLNYIPAYENLLRLNLHIKNPNGMKVKKFAKEICVKFPNIVDLRIHRNSNTSYDRWSYYETQFVLRLQYLLDMNNLHQYRDWNSIVCLTDDDFYTNRSWSDGRLYTNFVFYINSDYEFIKHFDASGLWQAYTNDNDNDNDNNNKIM